MTLLEALDAAADADPGIVRESDADGSVSFSRGGIMFASLDADGRRAEFRLDPTLAAAARRTPDATESDRGPEWVAFAPTDLDGPAIDRASAWFAAGGRRAIRG